MAEVQWIDHSVHGWCSKSHWLLTSKGGSIDWVNSNDKIVPLQFRLNWSILREWVYVYWRVGGRQQIASRLYLKLRGQNQWPNRLVWCSARRSTPIYHPTMSSNEAIIIEHLRSASFWNEVSEIGHKVPSISENNSLWSRRVIWSTQSSWLDFFCSNIFKG